MIKDFNISIKAVKYNKSNQKEVLDFINKINKSSASVKPNEDGMPIDIGQDDPLTIGNWLVLKDKTFLVVTDDEYEKFYKKWQEVIGDRKYVYNN